MTEHEKLLAGQEYDHLHKIFYALLMPFVSHTSLSEDSIA